MSRQKYISIIGLYEYDPSLFEDMLLPDNVDRITLANNLVMDLAEMEVIYPSPSFMKRAINMWSASRVDTWRRMSAVLAEEYDPFINIQRDEVRTITEERDLAGTSEGSTVNSSNAFNEGTTERDRAQTNVGTTDKGTVTTTEHFHVEGDSAITDAQDVLKKEMEVRKLYNIYDVIISEFKDRFCLSVY